MSLSSREIEEVEKEPYKETRFTNFFVSLVRFLTKVPIIRTYIANSSGGLSGSIFSCWDQKNYEKACNIAIYALEKFRNKKSLFLSFMDHHNWWQFMKHGVDSAKWVENDEIKEKFIEFANSGIEPFEGHYVAYSFLEFSRWKYKSKDYEKAIQFAEVAARADETWAEPDFILGWYGLVLSKGSSEEHLCRAIEKDQRVLFRIASNEIFKQYPHIIAKLKEKYSTVPNEKSPNKSLNQIGAKDSPPG